MLANKKKCIEWFVHLLKFFRILKQVGGVESFEIWSGHDAHNSMFYLYNGSRVLDLYEKKNYQPDFSQIPAFLCHSCLMTLSQTNHWWKYDFVCYVITIQTSRQVKVSLVKWKVVLSFILVTLNLINELFGTHSFCSLEEYEKFYYL